MIKGNFIEHVPWFFIIYILRDDEETKKFERVRGSSLMQEHASE